MVVSRDDNNNKNVFLMCAAVRPQQPMGGGPHDAFSSFPAAGMCPSPESLIP